MELRGISLKYIGVSWRVGPLGWRTLTPGLHNCDSTEDLLSGEDRVIILQKHNDHEGDDEGIVSVKMLVHHS